MPDTGETHFGFRTVDVAHKQAMVDGVFHRVARRYDLMNDLTSGGLHRVWKDAMVTMLNPPRSGRYAVVDVAGGTGDVAFSVAEAGGSELRPRRDHHDRDHSHRLRHQPDTPAVRPGAGTGTRALRRRPFTAGNAEPCRCRIAARTPAPSPSASATCADRGRTPRVLLRAAVRRRLLSLELLDG